jgi:hypothetical protein
MALCQCIQALRRVLISFNAQQLQFRPVCMRQVGECGISEAVLSDEQLLKEDIIAYRQHFDAFIADIVLLKVNSDYHLELHHLNISDGLLVEGALSVA